MTTNTPKIFNDLKIETNIQNLFFMINYFSRRFVGHLNKSLSFDIPQSASSHFFHIQIYYMLG